MWLVGMMGSGKTVAGRRAASRLGVGFADTDELVAERAGRPIPELWESEGEGGFRARERVVLGGLAGFDGIVATGGGAVLDEGNRTVIGGGTVVWLRAEASVLAERVGRSGAHRPLLPDGTTPSESLTRILDERNGLYRMLADHQIETEGLDVDEVAHRIEALWNG